MLNLKNELTIILSIVTKPANTIKSGLIDSYNKKNMNNIFFINISFLCFIFNLYRFYISSKQIVPISAAVFTMIEVASLSIIVKYLLPIFFKLSIKFIGKTIIDIKDIRQTILPIYLIHAFTICIFRTTILHTPTIFVLIQLISRLWFLLIISLVLKYKYKLSTFKIVIIQTISIIIIILLEYDNVLFFINNI